MPRGSDHTGDVGLGRRQAARWVRPPRAAVIMAHAGQRRGSPPPASAPVSRARHGAARAARRAPRGHGSVACALHGASVCPSRPRGRYERAERTVSRERGRAWRERGRARGHLFRCSGSHCVCPPPRPCGFACHSRPVCAASVPPWPGARGAAVKDDDSDDDKPLGTLGHTWAHKRKAAVCDDSDDDKPLGTLAKSDGAAGSKRKAAVCVCEREREGERERERERPVS